MFESICYTVVSFLTPAVKTKMCGKKTDGDRSEWIIKNFFIVAN